MKHINKVTLLLLIIVTVLVSTGCASSKKGCGCPNQSGMVGYK
jgi:hypothetical protein